MYVRENKQIRIVKHHRLVAHIMKVIVAIVIKVDMQGKILHKDAKIRLESMLWVPYYKT